MNLVYTLSHNFQIFSNFFVLCLCRMLQYFGKCFGLSTRAPTFLTKMPQLFVIKICFTIKVNSVCGASRDTRNLCQEFNSQGPALKIRGVRVAIPKFQRPISRVPESQGSSSESQDLRIPGLRVLALRS